MRICFIGDSFVNGTGDDECLGWSGRICARARQTGCDVTLYNLGIRRDTSADILARWEREARARLLPEHDGRLVFSFGVNDCVHEMADRPRVPEDDAVANAQAILASAAAWLPTLMVGPPWTGEPELDARVRRLSARLGSLCGDLSVPYLAPWDAHIDVEVWHREALAGDGIHPNRRGYALIADLVDAWPPWRRWVG
ncbi:MAG TPA: GDSL-type esterase/lipase family protein [Acetobacteraceae bacterium]|nr:GDSL-type esterase/lipase family protein [Acetobacteraceae bacterium]